MKRGQIWVETVIYTLIAFVMIGLVLAYAKPKIEDLQDKAIIEQSIAMMKELDQTLTTMGGAGNQRILEIGIKKGNLKIDGFNDRIIFNMESKHEYSDIEATIPIRDGNVNITTVELGSVNNVTLIMFYDESYNITYVEDDILKTISKSPVSYEILISNKGHGKFEEGTCTVDTDCADFDIQSKSCTEAGTCEYTEERIKINLEVR